MSRETIARAGRTLLYAAIALLVYLVLEHWRMGWLVGPIALLIAAGLFGAAAWHRRRARQRLEEIRHQLSDRAKVTEREAPKPR